MSEVHTLRLYVSTPTETELEEDIREAEQYAKEDPKDAEYFRIKEAAFKINLEILEKAKKEGIDPNTKEGAEKIDSLMDKATKQLDKEAYYYLKLNPKLIKYGWTIGKRHWFPV